MTDIISGGTSGGIVAIFVLGANWAKSLIGGKSSTNGNGEKYITRAEYEGRHQDIMRSLERIEHKVDSL